MTGVPALFAALVDDAAMFPPGNAAVAQAVAAHRGYRRSWFAAMVGPLVVGDHKLAELGRALRPGEAASAAGAGAEDLDVSVVIASGAGGLLALADRQPAGVRVRAVEAVLRDLDDLAGDAARIVSAVGVLGESVQVFVELPRAPGWERAAEVVRTGGLLGKIRTGGLAAADTPSAGQLARQLSLLVQADLPFKATAGLHHAWPVAGPEPDQPRQHGFLSLLAAVDALLEGASDDEAADLLTARDRSAVLETLRGGSETRSARLRSRLRSFGCCGVTDPLADLVALGLLEGPA
jgi:hypothetical protein